MNSEAPLLALKAMLDALTGMQQVHIGTPENLGTRVSAYINLADRTTNDKATQLLEQEQRYLVTFGYRVQGAEATAEREIAKLMDAFEAALYVARRDRTGVYANNVALPPPVGSPLQAFGGTADYITVAGQEYRIYPVVVRVVQRAAA